MEASLFLRNASILLVSPIFPQPSQIIKDVYEFLHSLFCLSLPFLKHMDLVGRDFENPTLTDQSGLFPFNSLNMACVRQT